MRMVYRRATKRDAEAIAAVTAQVVAEAGAASGLAAALTAAQVAELVAGYRGRGAMFVCRADGEAAGFAALEPIADEPGAAAMGVWVLPAQRRRGVATQLALMALNFARAKGYRKVRGTLPAGNEAALSFFSSIGALAPRVAGDLKYELPL